MTITFIKQSSPAFKTVRPIKVFRVHFNKIDSANTFKLYSSSKRLLFKNRVSRQVLGLQSKASRQDSGLEIEFLASVIVCS